MKIIKVENSAEGTFVTVVDQALDENNAYTLSVASLNQTQYQELVALDSKFDQLNYLLKGNYLSKGKQVSEEYYENSKDMELSNLQVESSKRNHQEEHELNVYKGMIKIVPLEKHFKQYQEGKISLTNLKLHDTFTKTKDGVEKLSFKLLYLDGTEKYLDGVSIQNYKTTGELVAYGKEARILAELGQTAPVKVVCTKSIEDNYTYMKVECVQSQSMGMANQVEHSKSHNHAPRYGIDF